MHLRELDNAFSTFLNDELMKKSLNDYCISCSSGTSINVLSLNSGTRRERGRSRHLNQVNDEANVMNSSEASDDLYVKK